MYFTARVLENRSLGPGGFVLRLGGCEALAGARPGQFLMVRGEWGRDPLLPRAFSILRTLAGGECELLLKAVGRGTRLLERVEAGARLQILGPLGRPFPSPSPGERQLLVAGGVGLAPLLWHAQVAHAAGIETVLCYGARSQKDLVLLDQIPGQLHLATEDGSRGLHGRVTAAVEKQAREGVTILTCGPNPMMKAVAEIARARSLACFVSVEGEMACGIGACLGCAYPTVADARPFHYACVDGPVFDAAKIVMP